jgi:hypothetical protein
VKRSDELKETLHRAEENLRACIESLNLSRDRVKRAREDQSFAQDQLIDALKAELSDVRSKHVLGPRISEGEK